MNNYYTVIYSHTDYLDVLEIQTDYISNIKNKILLINRTEHIPDLYHRYDRVIYYDDNLPYAGRLLSLSELDTDYIFLIHDTDIIISIDNQLLNLLLSIISMDNIDRIDLTCNNHHNQNGILYNPKTKRIDTPNFSLIKQENIDAYIYNVNPSIWKLSCLLDIMGRFRRLGYREIELRQTQMYARQFDIYRVLQEEPIDCGYLQCNKMFQFFHITRGGKWFPITGNGRRLDNNKKTIREYEKIIKKYKLLSSKRPFRTDGHMIGSPFYRRNDEN